MLQAQRFALDNIYCAPGQDKQFCFKLVRLTKKSFPAKRYVNAYNKNKHLPNQTDQFHVFAIGNLPPVIINLLTQKQEWFRDSWINVATDMVLRNYLLKVYSQDGLLYPRQKIYYSFTDESSILIALEDTPDTKPFFNTDTFNYLSIYSNSYFNSTAFTTSAVRDGIDYRFKQVLNNLEKVELQTFANNKRLNGGNTFTYVNGYYVSDVRLDIPDGSFVEIVYDQSVLSKEEVPLPSMRTFGSTLDTRTKFLLFRDRVADHIQYVDDTELYVTTSTQLLNRGLYFYKHKDYVMRNVTDKDFSVDTAYLNSTAQRLSVLVNPGIDTKKVVLYTRKSGRDMALVYSAMKLHELYKLPAAIQLDVINNTGYTLDHFRAEKLEDSSYFKVASAGRMVDVTKELVIDAVGYNAMAYYFANSPCSVNRPEVEVPELYQWNAMAFEYNTQGLFTSYTTTSGPLYPVASTDTKHVSFMKGYVPVEFGGVYDRDAIVTLLHPNDEIAVISAYFAGTTRQSKWEDITNTTKVKRTATTVELSEVPDKKVRIVYQSRLNIYDEEMGLENGVLYFPITQMEDRGTGMQRHACEVPYRDISIYLNKRKLTQGIDYLLSFPYVCIFSKKYIDYALLKQQVHIRCSGFVADANRINELDIKGFVNNGVLTRNRYYDIRDDRVMSVFVDGCLRDRSQVLFSENDSTVRLSNVSNGLPYTVQEDFIPLRDLTGLDTAPSYEKNIQTNLKISGLFNQVLPEPTISEFNIINVPHTLYSPTLSKMINDIVTGVIPESLYSTPYNDNTINNLLNVNYKAYLALDPIKLGLPVGVTVVHPHIGNTVIPVNLLAYRFITNTVRLLTNNQPERINLSGYLSMV